MEKVYVTRRETLVGATAATLLATKMKLLAHEEESSSDAPTEVADFIVRHRPNLVVHAGSTAWAGWDVHGVDGARIDARCDLRRETELVRATSEACRAVEARFVLVSTDALFVGPRMFHAENAEPQAATWCAKAALAVEQAVSDPAALLLRGHVYGWMPTGGPTNYAERMFHSLTSELPCRVDSGRHASPILATDFVRLIFEAYRAGLTGRFNLSGAERTSPHRFAAELAAALGVPGCNVRLIADSPTSRRYRDETSLDVGRFRKALGRPLPMLREGLSRFVDEGFNGYRESLATSGAAPIETPQSQAA